MVFLIQSSQNRDSAAIQVKLDELIRVGEVQNRTAPLLGRSTHTLSAFLGLILLTLGLVWPRLRLGAAASRIAFWFLIYSGLAITAAFFLAGIWGAGRSTMPLAGAPLGSVFQEVMIMAVAYSSAPTGIVSFALIFWGLRTGPSTDGRGDESE